MTPTSDLDLAEFGKAILRSEKVRTLCMIIVIGMFAVLGLFRIVVPLEGGRSIGVFIFVDSVAYLALEIFMLRQVTRAIEASRPVAPVLARLTSAPLRSLMLSTSYMSTAAPSLSNRANTSAGSLPVRNAMCAAAWDTWQ